MQGAGGVAPGGEGAPAGHSGVGAGLPVLALDRHRHGLDGAELWLTVKNKRATRAMKIGATFLILLNSVTTSDYHCTQILGFLQNFQHPAA